MSVHLIVPAEPSYVSVLRTTAAAMAARCNLTYDRLEDARLAIDEAFAQVLSFARPDSTVQCSFEESPGELRFTLSGPTTLETRPATDTFAWTVLSALADELSAEISEGQLVIHARIHQPQEVGV